MLVIFPPAILVGAPVFVGVILVTRYVSLGSLLAITAGAILVGIWWLAANGTVPFAYPRVRDARDARWSGWPTPTTSTGCSRHGTPLRPGPALPGLTRQAAGVRSAPPELTLGSSRGPRTDTAAGGLDVSRPWARRRR